MTYPENHNQNAKTYVLYHANCFDGTGAAYAAWTRLGDENVEYLPVQYGSEPPEMEAGSNIYIVDFSYSKETLQAIRDRASTLVVLDHHKTAAEALEGFPGAIFDMKKSGAVLAWEYFQEGCLVPTLLEHIQDRDLWTWLLKDTKPIMAAMELYKSDFRMFDMLSPPALKRIGESKLQFDQLELDNAAKKCVITTFPRTQFRCAFLNANHLISEVGNRLSTDLDVDFSLSYFIDKSGDVIFSFRSIGGFDVSVLAKSWGGGGHRNASGARVPAHLAYVMLQDMYSSASPAVLQTTSEDA